MLTFSVNKIAKCEEIKPYRQGGFLFAMGFILGLLFGSFLWYNKTPLMFVAYVTFRS
jgi:hypothetical protein